MGFKRYKGPVTTLEQAMFADMPVRITCERCGHFTQMAAFQALRKLSEKRKEEGVKLWVAVVGLFKCKKCHSPTAKISAPMQSAY